jgi:hypothetical protein
VVEGESNIEQIQPHNIPELVDMLSRNSSIDLPTLTEDILQNFKVKVKQVEKLSLVWDSQGTQSQEQVSIWAPSLSKSILYNNRTKICLGHYGSKGFSNPIKGRNAKRFLSIEIVDYATIRMKRSQTLASVLNNIFPHPTRFKQIWHLARGSVQLYAWRLVPPDGFVAMGIICTTSDEPPDVKSVRCVPQSWTKVTDVYPKKVWDDSGAGGGKPGSMWTINSMDMIAITPGHDPPSEHFYEFTHQRFFLDGQMVQINVKK